MKVYRDLTPEAIESQYFLRGLRPDYEVTVIPGWLERSRRYTASQSPELDLAYGPRERNKLDFFPANGTPKGFVLYIHGGYWQRGDKSVYRFIAEPLNERGFAVALMNYEMCPQVRLAEIAPQARLAVGWLWRNAPELGIDRECFNVMGHSAGGHLTVEMLCTDWSEQGKDLPRTLLHAGVAVSGIYDFEPILYCTENEGLRLDEAQARAVSPIFRSLATDAPLLLAFGEQEPPDMQRQSRALYKQFEAMPRRIECLPVPGVDHFDVVNVMADPSSALFSRTIDFLRG